MYSKSLWVAKIFWMNWQIFTGSLLGRHLQCQQCQLHVTEMTELAVQMELAIAVSMASASQWNHLGVTLRRLRSRLRMYCLQHLMPQGAQSANAASASAVLWDADSLLHSSALNLHHFRTEVNQNPVSERDRD